MSNIYTYKSNTFFTGWNTLARGLGLGHRTMDQEAHPRGTGLADSRNKGEVVEGPVQESELKPPPTPQPQEVS